MELLGGYFLKNLDKFGNEDKSKRKFHEEGNWKADAVEVLVGKIDGGMAEDK